MTRKEVCGCEYDGPVQVLSCGEHNVAAKNLNKAQGMITRLEMERDQLQEKIKELEEVNHYLDHEMWKYAKETNAELAVKVPLADKPPITFGKMQEIIERRTCELLLSHGREKELADRLAGALQKMYDNSKGITIVIQQRVAAALYAYNAAREKRGDGQESGGA